MAYESKKNEGPICACGKVDLYEEMLKQQDQEKNENADVLQVCQISKSINADSAKKGKNPKNSIELNSH